MGFANFPLGHTPRGSICLHYHPTALSYGNLSEEISFTLSPKQSKPSNGADCRVVKDQKSLSPLFHHSPSLSPLAALRKQKPRMCGVWPVSWRIKSGCPRRARGGHAGCTSVGTRRDENAPPSSRSRPLTPCASAPSHTRGPLPGSRHGAEPHQQR